MRTSNYRTRNVNDIPYFNKRQNFSKSCFFPFEFIEWNKLESILQKAKSFTVFKRNILNFMRPKASSVFNCNSSKGLKLITRLRLRLTHLREHKFKHNFWHSINHLHSCGLDVEWTIYFTALHSQSKDTLSWTQLVKLTKNCWIVMNLI